MTMQRATILRWDELARTYTQWAEEFLLPPGALRIRGRPVCSFLNLTDFTDAYGFPVFSMMVRGARTFMRVTHDVDPFIVGLFNETSRRNVWLANHLDLDAATGYGMLPDWRGAPVQRYADLVRARVDDWYRMQRDLRIPFLPVVCCGWDASMRGEQLPDLRSAPGFPWRPVVHEPSPAVFAEFLDLALEFNARTHPMDNVVFIHAWNEWTEQSAVEESDVFGDAFLRVVAARA